MIRNDVRRSPADEVLDTLGGSGFAFYLTGSRFFADGNNGGVDVSKSDWDFFTLATHEVTAWLGGRGFAERRSQSVDARFQTNYRGISDCVAVLEHGNVQVQLVSDPALKSAIQNVLKQRFGGQFNGLSKHDRGGIWWCMYDAVHLGRRAVELEEVPAVA